MEYIQQVCRSVREPLEIRRRDFLKFLEQFKNGSLCPDMSCREDSSSYRGVMRN